MAQFRGTRKKKRSMQNRRLLRHEREALAAVCAHRRIRYRKRGLEAVCLDCGSVQLLKVGADFPVEVVRDWELPPEKEKED